MINPEKRTRPLPADGLARALRAGQRRRRIALGAGSGASAVVVATVFVLSGLGPPAAMNSLEIADDPTPSPTSTAPEPSESPAPMGTPRPAPTPTESVDCVNNDCEEDFTEEPWEPRPSEDAAGSRTRAVQPYVENPRQDGTCGSGGIPGTGVCWRVEHVSSVRSSETANFRLWLCAHDSNEVLAFTSGQEHELVIARAKDDSEVYRFSKTVTFPQGPHQRTVDSGTCLLWDTPWDTGTTAGPLVPSGRYTATLSLTGTVLGASSGSSFTDSYDFDVYE